MKDSSLVSNSSKIEDQSSSEMEDDLDKKEDNIKTDDVYDENQNPLQKLQNKASSLSLD